MKTMVAAQMTNGAGDLTLTYDGAQVVTGSADVQTLNVSNMTAGTFTADGIETLNINSGVVKSTLTNVASDKLKTVNVAGATDLKISTALTAATINAASATGAVSVKLGAADQVVTGGSGNDTIDAQTNLTKEDTIVGGDGTDTLKVSISAATAVGTAASKGALFNVSGVEVIDVASTADAAAIDLDNTSGVTTVVAAANVKTYQVTAVANSLAITFTLNGVAYTTDATDANATAAEAAVLINAKINTISGFSSTVNTDTVTITATTGEAIEIGQPAGGATAATVSAYSDVTFTNITTQAVDVYSAGAVAASLKDASGTADVLAINLKTVSADKGFNQTIGTVTANLIETINLSSTGMTDGKVKTLTSLAASSIKTLNITGESDLTISGFGTQVATIDGSTATADLNLTVSTKDQSIKTGSGNDTINMAATLTAADTIDGGANNAIAGGTTVGKDKLTASDNIGTVTTAAALKIANVETIEISNAGAAATYIDAAGITGAESIAFSAASGTVKVTNLAAGTKIGLSITDDEFDGTVDLALADATGAADSISLFYAKEADDASTVVVKVAAAVETLNIAATTESVGADTFTITSTDLASKNIVVTAGHSADTLDFGNLNAATTNVDASAYAGILTATTTATGAVTVSAKGGLLHNIVTGAGADTITLGGANGTAAVTINGNGGTDVLNINLDNGASDFTNVSNIETINITVAGNKQAGITAAAADNGLNSAKTVNILGGDALSTFTMGTNSSLDDDAAGTTLKLDASTFAGAIDIAVASDAFDAELSILGGALLTDKVTAIIAGEDNKVALMSGVETLVIKSTNNDVAASVDLTNVTGLTKLETTFVNNANADQIKVDKLAAGVSIKVTSLTTADNLVINLADVTGTADALTVDIATFTAANDVLNFDAAGIETLNLKVSSANAGKVLLDGVTATTGSTATINVSGTGVAELTSMSSSITTVVSTGTGALKIAAADRTASAMTITGGEGGDSIAMRNSSDVLTGGLGTDTLTVSFGAILGGIEVNLSAADQVVSMNGSANSTVQAGFESVNLSAFTGFGAVVTGSTGANTIVGTALADQITSGNGADVITGGGGNDVIDLTETTAASDTVVYAATASNNGEDAVSAFKAGTTSGDVLDFTAYLGAASGGITSALTANPGVATALTTAKVYTLVDIAGNQDITTAAGLATALAAGGEYGNLNTAVGAGQTYVFVTAASAAATTFNVFYASPNANAGTANTETFTVTLVGTVSADGAISTLVNGNFA
jgi:hypothetical protein